MDPAGGSLVASVTHRRLLLLARASLVATVAVVLFGAVVRATGSGAGCGSHWPTCGGEIVPLSGSAERFIEFGHRASSGAVVLLIGWLALATFRSRGRGDTARRTAAAALGLVLVEAAIGAMLVRFGWVDQDRSAARAISIAIHLVNTFLLLAALTLTERALAGRPLPVRDGAERRAVFVGAGLLLAVGAMGAITALGDTLFPAASLAEGLRDDLGGTLLVRLRWIHPVLAVVAAWHLLRLARRVRSWVPEAAPMALLVVVQIAAGVVNLALLAPVGMQVIHLLLADLVWIAFVATASGAMADRRVAVAA